MIVERMLLYVFTKCSIPNNKKSNCFIKNTEETSFIIRPKPKPQREFSEFVELIILLVGFTDNPFVKPLKQEPALMF